MLKEQGAGKIILGYSACI